MICFGCGSDSAHLDLYVRLCEAPVFGGRLNSGCGFNRLTKGMNRYAWRWCNMDFALGRHAYVFSHCDLLMLLHHFPTSLILRSHSQCKRRTYFRPSPRFDHDCATRRVRWRFAPRLNKIGGIIDHGREVALGRAAKIPNGRFSKSEFMNWPEIDRPLPTRARLGH